MAVYAEELEKTVKYSTLPYAAYVEKPSIWCRNPAGFISNKKSNHHRHLTHKIYINREMYLIILYLH